MQNLTENSCEGKFSLCAKNVYISENKLPVHWKIL